MATGIGNTLAQVGDLKAKIGLYVSPIIAIIFCCVGFWLINASKGDGIHTQMVTGTIQNISPCAPNKACTSNVSYMVSGNTYTIYATVQMGKQVNANPQVAYNPKNPADAIINIEPPSFMGYIFICLGFMVPLLAYGVYYLTTHSRTFAQLEGAQTLLGGLSGGRL